MHSFFVQPKNVVGVILCLPIWLLQSFYFCLFRLLDYAFLEKENWVTRDWNKK